MGFGNWLLKNGPGSPGSTAKHYADLYLKGISTNKFTPQEIWEIIYYDRQKKAISFRIKTNKFEYFDAPTLYNFCNGDLALFAFIMQYIETEQFRNGIKMNDSGFNSTLEIIRDVIQKKASQLITLSSEKYRSEALRFMNDIFIYGTSRV